MSLLTTESETRQATHRVGSRDVAITAVVAVALHLPAVIRKTALNSDEATMATVARMMSNGARLYSGTVDRKPPGAFLVYRLLEPIFGMWSLTAARWVALAAIVAAAWILALEARRRWTHVVPLAVAPLLRCQRKTQVPSDSSCSRSCPWSPRSFSEPEGAFCSPA